MTIAATGQSTVTGSDGMYVLSSPGAAGTSIAVTAGAPGFARQTHVTTVSVGGNVSFALRAADLYITVPLTPGPDQNTTSHGWQVTQNAAGVKVSTTTTFAGMSLFIPAGAMVTPDGTTATGNANLAVTYWEPGSALSNAPGSMNATFNGQAVPLETFGMADIQVEQNGNCLQVSPGNHLPATFTLPAQQQLYTQSAPLASPIYPSLWYEDESTGLWTQQGTAAQGNMTYDGNTGIITAMLPHLSGWNVDSVAGPNGCVQGTAVDETGKPVSSQQFNLWLIGTDEQDTQYYPANTDAAGNFCVNVSGVEYGTIYVNGTNGLDSTAPVFASYGDPSVAVCNPLPITQLSQCAAEPVECIGAYNTTTTVQPNLNNCSLPVSSIGVCHYCPGTGASMPVCYYLAHSSVTSTPTEGGCPNIGKVTLPTATAAQAQACMKTPLMLQGQTCATNADCCSFTGALICADSLCVPAN